MREQIVAGERKTRRMTHNDVALNVVKSRMRLGLCAAGRFYALISVPFSGGQRDVFDVPGLGVLHASLWSGSRRLRHAHLPSDDELGCALGLAG